tara:strand:+ start:117 stop:329 length:213 start_codon:yes stop_codon:yes gene_type:complete
MTIESIKYGYSDTDTSVSVSYTENGVESTVTVNTVMSNSIVDTDATELAIKTAVYGTETPPNIAPALVDD